MRKKKGGLLTTRNARWTAVGSSYGAASNNLSSMVSMTASSSCVGSRWLPSMREDDDDDEDARADAERDDGVVV